MAGGAQGTGGRAGRAFLKLPPGLRLRILHARGRYAPWEDGYDFTPPVPAAGDRTGPPDFVGIGVQKAGTTWWYRLILSHPDVAPVPGVHKERHYFDRFESLPFGPDEARAYGAWFPRPPGARVGEWTPDYFSQAGTPGRLRTAAPDARLLVLLRDPVARFASGLAHYRRLGTYDKVRSVDTALRRGFYGRDLRSWYGQYAPDQVLVLQYEACAADPARHLAATFAFLGLDPFTPEGLGPAAAGPGSGPPADDLTDAERRRLVEAYEGDVAGLVDLVPDLDLARWPNFAYLVGDGPSPGADAASPTAGTNSPTARP